jgi:hypothetical protein
MSGIIQPQPSDEAKMTVYEMKKEKREMSDILRTN